MEIWNRRNPVGGAPIVDSALDVNSEHCVQNKVVAEQFSAINSNLQPVDVDFSWGDSTLDRTYNHVKKMGRLVILNMLLYTDGISSNWNTIGTVEAPPKDAFVFNGYDSNSGECCEILIRPDKTIQIRSVQVSGYGFIRATTCYFTE